MAAPSLEDQNPGHKLFVGGLPVDCTQEELVMVFSTYGQLEGEQVHMMPPKSKSGLRCAFVFYSKRESAEDAIKVLDGVYKIREDAEAPIQVRWPRDNRSDFGGGGGGGDWGKGGGDWGKGGKGDWGKGGGWGKDGFGKGGDWGKDSWGKGGKDDVGKGTEGPKLFVGSLPADCTDQELKIVFSTYGEVTHVHLMHPHNVTGMRCAFVTYVKPESAEDAIKVLDGIYKIRENADQPIQVRWANDRSKGGGPKGGKDKGWPKGGGKDWQPLPWKGGGGDWGWQEPGWGGGWWDEPGWGKKGGKFDGKGKKGDGKKGDFKGGKGDWGWDGGKGKGKPWKGGKGDDFDGGPEGSGHRVYVSNLPLDIQQNALEYVFGTYGKVEKVHIMANKVINGCIAAFVEFHTADEAETAIASLHEKYEIRPGYGPLVVRHASTGKGRSKPY